MVPGFNFQCVGVDYAGPVLIKSDSVRKPVIVKAYVSVFVTSGNALKTVTSSKSERTLMALVVVGLTVPPVQQKECYVPREIL